MTPSERRFNWLVLAVVFSLAAHVGIMIYARPRVMTRVVAGVMRAVRVAPMRVTRNVPMPDPVRIDAVEDVEPIKAPPLAPEPGPELPDGSASGSDALAVAPHELPRLAPDAGVPPPVAMAAPVFDARPVKMDDLVSAKIPMARIETPMVTTASPASEAETANLVSAGGAAPKTLPAPGVDENSLFLPSTVAAPVVHMEKTAPAPVVELPKEVVPEVDEQVVEAEKTAVKNLVDADDAEEMTNALAAVITVQQQPKWTYFRVTFAANESLTTIPKDFVLLIDASGSIGNDRMRSIRKAARQILRSATNTGDRFNLVAFRDRYAYAFKTWQECDQPAFDRSDAWLNRLAAHGRTDVFSTITSVLTLPREPSRPLIALVVTDGDANTGISNTAEILARFTRLNDGLISVYMYGVKSSANRELIDVLTHGNRGESTVFDGWWWQAGSGLEPLSERFRDPLLSDLRVVFAADTPAEAYPRLLRNLYRGQDLSFVGRVPAGTKEVAFSIKGLNGTEAYEGYYRLSLIDAIRDSSLVDAWSQEHQIDLQLRKE